MARLARVEYEGAIYHVILRGNNRRVMFVDDRDRERFVTRLGEYAEEYSVRIYAFCLMNNHVHLVLETPCANLGRFMHKLETSYTIYFNLRHNESGHLMQGRYKAKPVKGDDYLLNLARYVQLNPVFVSGIEKKPLKERIQYLRNYRWNSYRRYLGKKEWEFVDEQPLLAMMHRNSASKRRAAFRAFVEMGIAQSDEETKEELKASPFGIGDAEFRIRMQELYLNKEDRGIKVEDIALRREKRWLPTERILEEVCRQMGVKRTALLERRRESWLRPVAGWVLGRHGGLTQREIAVVLGIGTGKAVSLQMERIRQALGENSKLARQVKTIEAALRR